MAYQIDCVMRTITDACSGHYRTGTGENEIVMTSSLRGRLTRIRGSDLPPLILKDLADAGDINRVENELYECLDASDRAYLEMALAFYMYLNQLDDDALYTTNFSRERKLQEGINSVSAQFGISVLKIS